jgi:hypothetical protein
MTRHEVRYTTLQARGTGLMRLTGLFTNNVRRHEIGYSSPQVRGTCLMGLGLARNDLGHLSVCHCGRSGKSGAGQQADCGG